MRPKPKVLLETYNKTTHRTHQIVEANAFYVVMYDGKPFNSKNLMTWLDNPQPKYQRNSFAHIGSAIALARRLNTKYKTDKFAAYRVAAYEAIAGDKDEE